MSNLTILSKEIRTQDGLFNLNDLHKAVGGEAKHQPHRFFRLEQTKALIDELSNYPDVGIYKKVAQGKYGGTYVCEELLLAYAIWVSAKVHLLAIRALKQQYIGQSNLPTPATTQPVITIITRIEPGKAPVSQTLTEPVAIIPLEQYEQFRNEMIHNTAHYLKQLNKLAMRA